VAIERGEGRAEAAFDDWDLAISDPPVHALFVGLGVSRCRWFVFFRDSSFTSTIPSGTLSGIPIAMRGQRNRIP
jgi:hypothetical protein